MAKGKNTQMFMWIAVLAVVGLLVWGFAFDGFGGETIVVPTGGTGPSPTTCADSTGTLTVNTVNAATPGTAVSAGLTAGVDGGAVTKTVAAAGTTTFPVGAKIHILANASDYLDDDVTVTMACGGSTVDLPLWYSTSDNPSVSMTNKDNSVIGDTGASGNYSDISAGETVRVDIDFEGTYQEFTGEMVLIVETPAGTSGNITSMTFDGQNCGTVPTVHSTVNAGSKVCAYEVTGPEGSVEVTGRLTIETTGDMSGLVLMDYYTKQKFVDDNGKIEYGIADSDGDAQYENTDDFDWYIDAA